VSFTGVFNYAPNADGAIWFSRHDLAVVGVESRAKLTLAGAVTTRASTVGEQDRPSRSPAAWPTFARISGAPRFPSPRSFRRARPKQSSRSRCGRSAVGRDESGLEGLPIEVRRRVAWRRARRTSQRRSGELLALAPGGRRREAARARLSELTWSRRLAPMLQLLESAANSAPRCDGVMRRDDAIEDRASVIRG